MANPKSKLLLCCDSERQTYTLRFIGEGWANTFTSTADAMAHAATIVSEETEVTVYNIAGDVMLVTTVAPVSTVSAS